MAQQEQRKGSGWYARDALGVDQRRHRGPENRMCMNIVNSLCWPHRHPVHHDRLLPDSFCCTQAGHSSCALWTPQGRTQKS